MTDKSVLTARRHDLDWLRVLLFAVLIFYHIGMVYVADWGYHYKSQYQSEWLKTLMIFVNQWRLPLLFLISGIAIRFLLNKVSVIKFVGLRTLRLWVPLLFAIWVIVPPQLYVEMISKGDLPVMSYGQFYQAFLDLSHPYFEHYQSGIFPHVDVNHLWYIRELWYFSMYLLLAYGFLSVIKVMPFLYRIFQQKSLLMLYLLLVILMSATHFILFPLASEGERKALGFSFLCYGFLIGWQPQFWQQVTHHRKQLLCFAILTFSILISYYYLYYAPQNTESKGGVYFIELLFVYGNRWAWILTILGFGHYYLNRNHRYLKYFNEAVYPYYILHQTLIIVSAYLLNRYQLGAFIEPVLVIILTFSGCALGYELIRRSAVLRLLFGLKIDTYRANNQGK